MVILAFGLLVALVLYLRSAEPVAHSIVDAAPPGDGCALWMALSLALPGVLVVAMIAALAVAI